MLACPRVTLHSPFERSQTCGFIPYIYHGVWGGVECERGMGLVWCIYNILERTGIAALTMVYWIHVVYSPKEKVVSSRIEQYTCIHTCVYIYIYIHDMTWHDMTLHDSYITLHYITLHYITLDNITLHFNTLHKYTIYIHTLIAYIQWIHTQFSCIHRKITNIH